jgi:1-acyl-sn-glycerol-3-phosphate acyltransferase
LIRLVRFARLALHLVAGALTILLLFPWLERQERDRRVGLWAGKLLRVLKIRTVLRGRPPLVRGQGALIVANHVSWLDIHLLHSLLPARFISKAEVRGWPMIGWMAEAAGTLFLERSRKSDAARMNAVMAEHLRDGDCLALFPEGTTTDGSWLRPFYSSLFQPAVEAGAQVWPAVIRYRRPDGMPCTAAAYYDDVSLGSSLRGILSQTEIVAEIRFLPAIAAAGLTRRDLARLTEEAMRSTLVGDAPDSSPGTADRHRVETR